MNAPYNLNLKSHKKIHGIKQIVNKLEKIRIEEKILSRGGNKGKKGAQGFNFI
jgi:hypothetical protein